MCEIVAWTGSPRSSVLFIWSPVLQGRQHRAEQEREQAAKRVDLQQQRDAQNAAAVNAITERGLMAFTEPNERREPNWGEFADHVIPGLPLSQISDGNYVASEVVPCVFLAAPHPQRHITPSATEVEKLSGTPPTTIIWS